MESIGLTKETPKVSHLANARGKTGKSTARMQMNVKRSIWALYVVNAGRGVNGIARERDGLESRDGLDVRDD